MKHDLSKTKEQLIAELEELRKQSKRREEELEKSRRDLLEAQKMAKIGNWSYDILEDKSTWSEEMFRIFDISPKRGALSLAEHRKFIHPDDLKELDELMQNAVKDGKDYKKQFRIVRNNKGIKWVQTIGHAIKNDKGKTVKLFGTIQDITERKHSEDRVSELKEFNESIVRNLAEGIILENDNGIIQFANPAMLRMLGYKEGELLGKYWNCFVPDDQIEAVKNANQRRKKGESDQYEMQLVRKDGERIFVLVRGTPNVNKRKYIGLLATFTDITERKQAEKELAQTFELLSNLASLVPGVLYQYRLYPDGSSAFPYSSPGMNTIYEVTPEQVREDATPVFGRLHPEDADRVSDLIFESARTLEEFYCEFRVILPGQGLRWRWSQAHPERTADGGTLWHGIISDITERKQTEEALRESEEKFSTFMDTAYDLMSITDKDGRFTYVNESMINKLEYSRDELIGKHITEILPKEAIEKDFQPNWPVFLENGKLNVESKLLTKSGDIIDCTLKAVAIYDKDDNFIGSRAVISDITERKQAEENLKKSEERFRALHNASFGGIAIHDKGVILECNLGLSQISGFSRDELIGADGVGLLIAQESRETVMNNIRSGYEKSYEVFGLRKNGEKYPVRLEARKIPYKDKNVRVVEFRDITEKKKIEHELIKAQEETLLKNKISNAFILADDDEFYNSILDMILETFNCKFGFFGYMDYSDEEKLICPSMTYDIWDECQIPGKSIEFPKSIWAGIWGESLKTKTSIYKNSDLKLPAGHVQLENALAVPIIYKMKLLGQIVVGNNREGFDDSHKEKLEEICNYISPLLDSHLMEKIYESELISAKEKAEESNRLKTAFLNNMSHEIRTPLNGITGFIGIMQDGVVNDAEKKEYFDIINKSSERLIATVTDIVDISKIEAGEVKVSKKKVSVNEILEDHYNFFYHEAKSKGLELIYKPNLSDKESLVITDKNKLEGILTNLIKNAIKYTEQGEITFSCSLQKVKDNEVLEFYVKDTGIGIPANRIESIFNRFEQADIEDKRAFEGSGLGLAIAKSYVEMLGGSIRVISEEGKGSTFTFSIPYTKQVVKESDAKENTSKEPQVSLSNLSVIIAEDDETSIMLFETIFKSTFSKITYTKTGQETIDKCRENPETDLILMDIKMPDMNGYEATREIRKFNSDVVIIAQTAYGLKGDRQKAIDSGCNDYITKPIKKQVLIDKIRICLNNKST